MGRRLFLDSYEELRGAVLEGRESPFSHAGGPNSPGHPASIVYQLEFTAAGRQRLLDRWTELRATLDQHQDLPLHDRLKVIRLLGKASLDAPGDADIAAVMPIGVRQQAMAELAEEMMSPDVNLDDDDPLLDDEAPTDEGIGDPTPEDIAAGRERLRAVVGRSIARLEALAQAHRERAEADAAEEAARLSFDPSTEGERLRRYQFGCNRVLFRTLDTLLKLRRNAPSTRGKRGRRAGDPEGQGEGRPSPAEAESVAQTYTPILFAEDDVPSQAAPPETRRGDQPEECDPLVLGTLSLVCCCDATVSSLFAEPGPAEACPQTTDNGQPAIESAPAVSVVLPCGPEPHDDHRNAPNEPTVAACEHQNLRNEPTTPANGCRIRQNEPTTPANGHRIRPTEPPMSARRQKPSVRHRAGSAGLFPAMSDDRIDTSAPP
jgi:hypothetical protein